MTRLTAATTQPYTIHCGDCLTVMRGMAADSVDAVVTDPPYATQLNPDTCGWDVWPQTSTWAECARILKPGGILAFTISPHLMFERVPDVVAAGFRVLEVGCWVYGNGRPVHVTRPKRCWDAVVFMAKGKDSVTFQTDTSRGQFRQNTITGREGGIQAKGIGPQYSPCDSRNRYQCGEKDYFPANVMCEGVDDLDLGYGQIFAVKRARTEVVGERHPTQKPIALMLQLVRLCCPLGGTVLDPWCGSGTTIVAALEAERVGIGIELDPGYHAIAERRIKHAAAQRRMFA